MTTPYFFNTIGLTHQDLVNANAKAKSQEQKIVNWMAYMRAKYGVVPRFAPSDIHAMVFGCQVPLTSARRAITNLEKRGELIKTANMKMGKYGKPEHIWISK